MREGRIAAAIVAETRSNDHKIEDVVILSTENPRFTKRSNSGRGSTSLDFIALL